jgi:hypothetical protein
MFEVKLKYKYEDLYRFREIDKVTSSSVYSSPRVSISSPHRVSTNLLPLAKKLTGLNSPGNSRNDHHKTVVRTTYGQSRKTSQEVVPGHLMPKVRPGSSQAAVNRFVRNSPIGNKLKTIDDIKKKK